MARLHARPFHAVALLSRIEVLMRHTGPCIQIGGYKRQIPIRQLNVDKLAIRRVGSRMESEVRVRQAGFHIVGQHEGHPVNLLAEAIGIAAKARKLKPCC